MCTTAGAAVICTTLCAGLSSERTQVLREVVDADHLRGGVARGQDRCPFRGGDHPGRLAARDEHLDPGARRQLGVEATFAGRVPQLRLDRLRDDGRGERALDLGHRIVRRLRKMAPAVRRSRVADGSIRRRATSWPSLSDGTT